MYLDDWKPLLRITQVISTCFGMSANSLLILLILFRAPQNLGVYKILMVYTSVFELFFGMLELLAVPDLRSQGNLLVVLSDPETSYLPSVLLQATTILYCGSFGLSLAIFGVQFVYRYLIFQGKVSYTKTSPRNIIFWMGSPLIFAAVWAAGCGIFLGRNQYVDRLLITNTLPIHYHNVSINDIGVICVYFFPKLPDGSEVINWDSWIGLLITTVLLIAIESLMLITGIKCYECVQELTGAAEDTQSTHFRQIQRQLFYALVSQTFIPIIFMQLPISIMYISIFANSSTEFFGMLQMFTIPLYLATDALPTIFIVKSFRETVFEYLNCIKCNIKITFRLPRKRNGVGTGTPATQTMNFDRNPAIC